MSEQSGFFNANLVDGEPDRAYEATDFAGYFANLIGNGVFYSDTTDLKVIPSTNDLSVLISQGAGFIKGYWYKLTEELELATTANSSSTSRWDKVIMQLDLTARGISVIIEEGIYSNSQPTNSQLSLIRGEEKYQLCLGLIQVRPGQLTISTDQIVDLRSNKEVCGWVTGLIEQLDTEKVFQDFDNKFNSWLEDAKSQIDNETIGKIQNQIDQIGSAIRVNFDTNDLVPLANATKTEQAIKYTIYPFSAGLNVVGKSGSQISIGEAVGGMTKGFQFNSPGVYRVVIRFTNSLRLIATGYTFLNEDTKLCPYLAFGLGVPGKINGFTPSAGISGNYFDLVPPVKYNVNAPKGQDGAVVKSMEPRISSAVHPLHYSDETLAEYVQYVTISSQDIGEVFLPVVGVIEAAKKGKSAIVKLDEGKMQGTIEICKLSPEAEGGNLGEVTSDSMAFTEDYAIGKSVNAELIDTIPSPV